MCRFSSQILIKMTEQEFYRKTDECIARFKNGKERYKTSATFNRVVQMLVRDADIYEIIDHLCQMSDDQTKAFKSFLFQAFVAAVIFTVLKQGFVQRDIGTTAFASDHIVTFLIFFLLRVLILTRKRFLLDKQKIH